MMHMAQKARAVCRLLPILAILAAGCGGGGGTSPATVSLTGEWDVTETILSADPTSVCDVVGDTMTWSANVVQNGNDVTVTITSGDNVGSVFTGTVSGDQIDWQGSYPTAGGTTTVTGTDVTATNTSLTGTANWEWTDGTDSCSGTTRVTGSKS